MSSSIGRIGRVGSISSSAVSAVSQRSFAYQVSNTSDVSKAYTERISGIDAASQVDPVDPVKYATAARGKAQASKDANAGFNDLAETFEMGGYTRAGGAYEYSVVGKNYDEFV